MNDEFKEKKVHGRMSFPFAVYRGEIPKWIRGFPLHWHKEFEIIYIFSGNGIININSNIYEANGGDIFLIPPETIHGIHQKNDEPMVYFNILFRFSLLEFNEDSSFYQKYFLPLENRTMVPPERITPDNKESSFFRPILQSFCDRWQEDFSEDSLFVKTQIFAIVNELNKISKPEHKEIGNAGKNIMHLKPILKYINENYAESITISQAAKMCNYSESFFMKSFKNSTGMSFITYLNNFRLEKAEDLLKNSSLNVSEVSMACGFQSLSYFIKCYKSKWGYTPKKTQTENLQ